MKVAAYLLLFVSGVLAGFAAGVPALVDRVGLRVVHRLEAATGLDLEASQVRWDLGGHVELDEFVARRAGAPVDEPAVCSAERVTVDALVSLTRAKVRLVRVAFDSPRLFVAVGADGRLTVERAVLGLLDQVLPSPGIGAGGGGLGRFVERRLPEVSLDDLELVADVSAVPLPGILRLPSRVVLRGGTVTIHNPALLREEDSLELEGKFTDTTLDPGYGLTVNARVALRDPVPTAELAFDRPARVMLGRRVLAVGGLAWDGEAVEAGELALSVPLGAEPSDEPVEPAVTLRRLRLVPDEVRLGPFLDGVRRGQRITLDDLVGTFAEVELHQPALVFERRPGGHNFSDLVPPTSDLGEAGEAATAGDEGPDKTLGPLMEATRRAAARLAGKRPPDGANVRGFVVRGMTRLEGFISSFSDRAPALARPWPFQRLRVRGGHFVWRDASSMPEPRERRIAERLENFDLDAERAGELLTFTASFVMPGSERETNKVDGRIALDTGDMQLHAGIARLGLQPYRQVFPASIPILPDTMLHDTDVTLVWTPSSQVARLEGELSVTDGAFHLRPLARETLTGIDLSLTFSAQLDRQRKTFVLGDSQLTVGKVKMDIRADVAKYDTAPKVTGVVRIERARCQDLVDAIPVALIPMLEGLKVEGTFGWQLDVTVDTADVESLVYHSYPDLHEFRVIDMGYRLNLDAVRGTFIHRIQEADGGTREMLVGPGSPGWVPLGRVSKYLVKAITTTEDGSFFRHKGFSTWAIRESLVTNLKKGGFIRGASTITQQLVKNLFLSREKTISRKLQEMFITWQIESAIDKERILELYLNIIEWGPGLYGVRRAARHYFGVHPSELTLVEAIFLDSLIPNPNRYYHQYARGEVTDGWRRHLRWIAKVMLERGKITEDEFLAGIPYSPVFRGARGDDDREPDDRAVFDEAPAP